MPVRMWKHKDNGVFAKAFCLDGILEFYDVNELTVDGYHLTYDNLIKKFKENELVQQRNKQ